MLGTLVITDSRGITYKIFGDTAYNIDTPDIIVNILEKARTSRAYRLKFYYGDNKTGTLWGEEIGYVGRSTESIKIPLVIFNSRSLGGPALLDHCIVKIEYANRKQGGVLYQHPNLHP